MSASTPKHHSLCQDIALLRLIRSGFIHTNRCLFHLPFFLYFGCKSPFLGYFIFLSFFMFLVTRAHSSMRKFIQWLIFLSVCSVTQILLEVTSKVNIHFRLLNWCNVWCCSRIQCLCNHMQHFPHTPFHYYTVPNSLLENTTSKEINQCLTYMIWYIYIS